MATFTWTGSNSTDWNTNGNWNQPGTPGSGDSVIIGTTTRAPTLSASATVNSVTINGSDTLTLSGAPTVLTVTNGATLSSTGGISGFGTVAATVVTGSSAAAATITASGGTLEITGGVGTGGGGTLALNIAGASDKLVLDAASVATSVTFGSSGTLVFNNGFINTVLNAMSIDAGTVQLAGPFTTLTDTKGMTLSTGTITGAGVIAAAVTATGAAKITANGGTLELQNGITDSGNALTLTITGASDRLLLDGTEPGTNYTANAVSFASSGKLELANFANLTVGTAVAIGAGTLQLDGGGGSFTDASGVTLGTGTITGTAQFASAVTATGAATITASGGTLVMRGAITDMGGMLTLTTAGASDVLTILAGGAAHAVTFGSSGTLNLAGGVLTIATQIAIGAGSVRLGAATSATLSDAMGVTLSGGSINGTGKLDAVISGTGTVKASGGTLELVSGITASEGSTFQINNDGSSALLLDAAPGSGNTFTFLGANGDLALANDTGFNGTIAGLNVGASGAKTNFVDIKGHTVTIAGVTGQGTASGTITLSDGAVLHLTGLNSSAWFANAVADGSTGTDIFVSDTACYCRGTMILTAAGEVAVEDLAIGDRVVTLSGGAQPIKWIGRRAYDGRFTAGNRAVLPIRIEAGALGDWVPARDLHVSPEHALYIDGLLAAAKLLVNGSSIRQEEPVASLEYFHIELDRHDILIADGAPAESYAECNNRGMFQNAQEFSTLYPGDDAPSFCFCAPRIEEGSPELKKIRAKLALVAEQREAA